jgi:hypothetical protein
MALQVLNAPTGQPSKITLAKSQPLPSVSVAKPQPQPKVVMAAPQPLPKIDVVKSVPTPKIDSVGTLDNQQPIKQTVMDLGKKIKAKFPGQYDDLGDDEVGMKVKAKFPGSYDDFIDLPQAEEKKPGFIQRAVQGLAKTPIQLGKAAVALVDLVGSKFTSDPERKAMLEKRGVDVGTKPTDAGYFGQVEAPSYTTREGIGKGFELGSYAIGSGGVKNLAEAGLKGAIKQGIIQGVKTGAGAGAAAGFGAGLQDENAGVVDVGLDTAGGAVLGGVTGGALGGATGATGNVVNRVLNRPNVVEAPIARLGGRTSGDAALDIVRPKLSVAEEKAALMARRGSETGLLKRLTIAPQEKDLAIAEAARPFVKANNTPTGNIASLGAAVDDSAALVRQGLENSKAIWSKPQLKGVLNKISLDAPEFINVKSDTILANKFNNFKSAIFKLADKADKKAVGLLDLRQDFDALVKKAFPKIYEKDSEILPVVRAFRDALNEFTVSKLPEGKLPTGQSIRDEWLKQHLLLQAMDNIAEKAPREGTTAIQEFLNKRPLLKKTLPFLAGSTATALGLKAIE